MVINTNITSINIQRQMREAGNAHGKVTEKLSSGVRINSAADDAAGLSISEKMRGQIMGMNAANQNTQDGISLLQTAEGAMNEQHEILQRMRELAVQAGNGTYQNSDKNNVQEEIEQLKSELTGISERTEFNGKKLLNGNMQPTKSPKAEHIAATKLEPAEKKKSAIESMLDDIDKKMDAIINNKPDVVHPGGTVHGNIFDHGVGGIMIKDIANHYGINLPNNWGGSGNQVDNHYNKSDVESVINQVRNNIVRDYWKPATEAINKIEQEMEQALEKDIAAGLATGGGISLQIGANTGQTMGFSINNMSSKSLGVDNVNVTRDAGSAIEEIDRAIEKVSKERSKLGAIQNSLEHRSNSLSTSAENLTASESRIRDADMAKEMMAMATKNILMQTGNTLLAQSNQKSSQVLNLLN